MNIVIRTDSSDEIGAGHLMRCLTLAVRLRNMGAELSFICRDLKGNHNRLVRERNFLLHTLPSVSDTTEIADDELYAQLDSEQCKQFLKENDPAKWIVVDHYCLDKRWEQQMRDFADNIMVIDDLANRPHDCELILDQNLFDKLESRYDSLIPVTSSRLLGPTYAMLRDQFSESRETLRKRTGRIERLFVFLGAADSHGITEMTLDALEQLDRPGIEIDLVVGSCNLDSERIEKRCSAISNCNFHQQVENMAEIMAAADLAVGAGGSTTWERCCLGLPTLFVATTDNEIELAQACGNIEIGRYIGSYRDIDCQTIEGEIENLFERPDLLRSWGNNAARLVDGGGAERVGRKMSSLRKMTVA